MTAEEFDFEKWKRCSTGEGYTLRDFFSNGQTDRFASGQFLEKCEGMTITEAIVEVVAEISNSEADSLAASINYDRLAALLEKCVKVEERGPWRSIYRKEGGSGEVSFELPTRKKVAEEAVFVTKQCSEFELLTGLDGEPKGLVSHLVLTASQTSEEKAALKALLGRDCCDNAGEFYPCQITECIVNKEFGVKEKAIFINKLTKDQLRQFEV